MGVFFKSIHPPFFRLITHLRERFSRSIHPLGKILQRRYGIHDRKALLLLILLRIGGSMARKEYTMIEIVDVLRRYQQGDGIRAIARSTGWTATPCASIFGWLRRKAFQRTDRLTWNLLQGKFSSRAGAEWSSCGSRSRSWPFINNFSRSGWTKTN